MDYSKLTDIEINGRVLHAITNGKAIRLQQASVASGETDYCNNPADAWPIIEDKKICLAFDVFAEPQDGGSWVAQPAYGWDRERVRNDNPLRAAMIVYLMMQESGR